jgi:hypothetical protein
MKTAAGCIFILLCFLALHSCSSGDGDNSGRIVLSENWLIKSSVEVSDSGNIISTDKFKPDNWYKTSVPSTVLNALIENGIYPDPRIGLNNYLIPDVSDTFNKKHGLVKYSYLKNKVNPWKDPYWYRTEFDLPEKLTEGRIWLNFEGINYRADVWLNGHKVADRNEMVGMFQRFKLDISPFVKNGGKNFLAVKIYQVDHPGIPDPGTQKVVFGPNRGHASDIFKDETLKFSGGWDCASIVRDRNMGIYQEVYITTTGFVSIENPYIISTLPLPDTSSAELRISCDLRNTGKSEVTGILTGKIDLVNKIDFSTYSKYIPNSMPSVILKKEVKLKANETLKIELNSNEFAQLIIKNPHLWWPNGYGKQNLHTLKLTFGTGNQLSDSRDVTFGIRQVTNVLKKIGNEFGRVFYINGRRIFCKGGWLQPDLLLNTNRKRAFDEARLIATANINMIASEDAPSPSEDIMDSYDKYGLMAWETFFQCYRSYPGTADANNPVDHQLALNEVSDILKRYRNHPSLVVWCVANENTVCKELYVPVRQLVKELDSTRPFLPCTSYDWNVDKLTPYIKPDLPLGTTDDGTPDYNWNPEPYYFNKVLEVTKQTFRNELGVPSIPTYSSLRKFIPKFSESKGSPIFPLDSVWAEKGAWDDNNYAFRGYDHAIRSIYGFPESVEDYARKAQYVNANSYRAMFEAANHRMWDITSGVMIWKLNSCEPMVLWQIYDWYLNQNAAYYFTQKALEPIHIQMNAHDSRISIINATYTNLEGYIASAKVIDFNLQTKWTRKDIVNMEADRYKELYKIPEIKGLSPVYFVKLELRNKKGILVSENLYWLSSKIPADMKELSKIEPVELKVATSSEETGKEIRISFYLKNPSDKLSFSNRLVITRSNGEEVLPTFWNDNFISLFPGEQITVKAVIAKEDLHGDRPRFVIENSKMQPLVIQKD